MLHATDALARRLAGIRIEGAHGFDAFGLSRAGVLRGLALAGPLYERWFRVRSFGVDNIPPTGPVLLASNHSGTLPFDAIMIWTDVVRRTQPPRVPRAVLDTFVSALPFLNVVFARAGAIGGSRPNVEAALEGGELVLVFPEGVPGISKRFRQRYELQGWRVGHAELAIRFGATVVPVAVIGAEEQMPLFARLDVLRALGLPHLPLCLVPFPLPVRYRIHYGAPIRLGARYRPSDADDPRIVEGAADEVKRSVAALIERGLLERKGIFT